MIFGCRFSMNSSIILRGFHHPACERRNILPTRCECHNSYLGEVKNMPWYCTPPGGLSTQNVHPLMASSFVGTLLGYQLWSQPQREGEQQIQIQTHKDKYSNNLTTTLISTLTSWCYHPLYNDLGFFQDLPNSCRFQATEFGNKATKKNSTH